MEETRNGDRRRPKGERAKRENKAPEEAGKEVKKRKARNIAMLNYSFITLDNFKCVRTL